MTHEDDSISVLVTYVIYTTLHITSNKDFKYRITAFLSHLFNCDHSFW